MRLPAWKATQGTARPLHIPISFLTTCSTPLRCARSCRNGRVSATGASKFTTTAPCQREGRNHLGDPIRSLYEAVLRRACGSDVSENLGTASVDGVDGVDRGAAPTRSCPGAEHRPCEPSRSTSTVVLTGSSTTRASWIRYVAQAIHLDLRAADPGLEWLDGRRPRRAVGSRPEWEADARDRPHAAVERGARGAPASRGPRGHRQGRRHALNRKPSPRALSPRAARSVGVRR